MEATRSRGRTVAQLSLLLAMLYFTSYITRLNFSAAMTEMISVGILNKAQAGIIGSALFFTYGFGQIISGMLSDRFSPNAIICLGLGITVSCNLLMPLVGDPILMALVWGVNGFAQAFFWPPLVSIMASCFDEGEYARGTLVISIGSHAATILIYVLIPLLLLWFDWRGVFFVAAAWAVLFAVAWLLFYPNLRKRLPQKESDAPSKIDAPRESRAGQGTFRLMTASGVLIMLGAIAMQGFLKDGVQSWMPTFFTEVFQMSSSAAILSNVILPIFNILVVTVATSLYRKIIRHEVKEAILLFGLSVALCILLALFFRSSAVLCLILASLITGCMHGINLMLICFVPRRFSTCGKAATMTGVCNACSYVGSTASSYGIALVAEKMGWQFTMFSWGAVALLGLGLCIWSMKKWNAFIQKENL